MARESPLYHFCVRWTRPAWLDQGVFVEGCKPVVEAAFRKVFDQYVFQVESVPWDVDSKRFDGANDHYQGYGKLTRKKDRCSAVVKKLRGELLSLELDGCKIGGVEVSPSSDAGKEALKNYAMKPDSRLAGPWFDEKETKRREEVAKVAGLTLRPWQASLVAMLKESPDDRSVIVISDPRGGAGKSQMCKYIMDVMGGYAVTAGSYKHVLLAISKAKDKPIYVMNVCRSNSSKFDAGELFHSLESVKDGLFTVPMYDSVTVRMKSPHVVLFTNLIVKSGRLSADRISSSYFTIEDGKLMSCNSAWVDAQLHKQADEVFVDKVKRKRDQDVRVKMAKRLKAGKDVKDAQFKEIWDSKVGAAVPMTAAAAKAQLVEVAAVKNDPPPVPDSTFFGCVVAPGFLG